MEEAIKVVEVGRQRGQPGKALEKTIAVGPTVVIVGRARL